LEPPRHIGAAAEAPMHVPTSPSGVVHGENKSSDHMAVHRLGDAGVAEAVPPRRRTGRPGGQLASDGRFGAGAALNRRNGLDGAAAAWTPEAVSPGEGTVVSVGDFRQENPKQQSGASYG